MLGGITGAGTASAGTELVLSSVTAAAVAATSAAAGASDSWLATAAAGNASTDDNMLAAASSSSLRRLASAIASDYDSTSSHTNACYSITDYHASPAVSPCFTTVH